MTKQELLAFVNDLDESRFDPGHDVEYNIHIAEVLYFHCCGGRVLAAVTSDDVEKCGFAMSEYDTPLSRYHVLNSIVDDIRDNLDYDDLLFRAVKKMIELRDM